MRFATVSGFPHRTLSACSVNKCKGLPFDTRNPYGFNKETLQAMEDSANMVGVSRGFDSIDDMIAELER